MDATLWRRGLSLTLLWLDTNYPETALLMAVSWATKSSVILHLRNNCTASVSYKMGKLRSEIMNSVRLLWLSDSVQLLLCRCRKWAGRPFCLCANRACSRTVKPDVLPLRPTHTFIHTYKQTYVHTHIPCMGSLQ